MISLIAAMGRNRVIGRDGGLPWRLPEDLRHFRELTMGKPVLMGRRTCESLGRPLPGRTNAVITRRFAYQAPGFEVYPSLETALAAFHAAPEIMIIGGASVYGQALPLADRIYLTLIHHDFEGDTRFPMYDDSVWTEVGRSDHAGEDYEYSFLVLEKRARENP